MTLLDFMVVIGTPYRLHGAFNKDITGATITVHYTPPSPGAPGTWAGTIENAATGGFYCDVTAAANNAAGDWIVWADAKVGGIVIAKTFGTRVMVVADGTPVY
jgi:hypothetical protein